MKLIHFGKYAGCCTVTIGDKFYILPTVINLDSYYAQIRQEEAWNGVIGCLHSEQSTDKSEMKDFRDKEFYQIGKQLAKL